MRNERFEEILEGIRQELLKANQHFKICWAIRLASGDIAKAREVYLTFFYYTMRSNDDRFCIAIHNVVKPDRDTANFTKLFNYMRSNKGLSTIFPPVEIDQMEASIRSHQSLTDRIKVIRNQYVAHNPVKKNHLNEATTYQYEEGKRLLEDLNNIVNTLSLKYASNTYSFDVSPRLNVEDMLRHLWDYRNEQRKQRRGIARRALTN